MVRDRILSRNWCEFVEGLVRVDEGLVRSACVVRVCGKECSKVLCEEVRECWCEGVRGGASSVEHEGVRDFLVR